VECDSGGRVILGAVLPAKVRGGRRGQRRRAGSRAVGAVAARSGSIRAIAAPLCEHWASCAQNGVAILGCCEAGHRCGRPLRICVRQFGPGGGAVGLIMTGATRPWACSRRSLTSAAAPPRTTRPSRRR